MEQEVYGRNNGFSDEDIFPRRLSAYRVLRSVEVDAVSAQLFDFECRSGVKIREESIASLIREVKPKKGSSYSGSGQKAWSNFAPQLGTPLMVVVGSRTTSQDWSGGCKSRAGSAVVNSKYHHKSDDAYDSLENSSPDSESKEFAREIVKNAVKTIDEEIHFKSKNVTKHNSIKENVDERTKAMYGRRFANNDRTCEGQKEGIKDIVKEERNQKPKSKGDKAHKVKRGSIKYPFSVSVQRKGTHYATGALIEQRWVLTVAGEFYNVRESIKFFRVRLGTVNCKKGGTLVPIKKVEIHPSYKHNWPSYDVALLRLASPVEFTDTLKPIPLSRIKGKVLSAKFLATYWPRLIIKGRVLSSSAQERVQVNSMRVSTQKMIPWSWCHSLMSTLNYTLEESSLCLDPIISHHSLCLPDAGAPVTADDGLWGITSGWTSEHCLSQPSPTIFTRISSTLVRTWLDSKLTQV
ncbi:uncharacterized protein [Battus philenor]|uniref:uncharacterized protein n=1 Tax=Battus philenor TaxID=42288 RepID=UPI0035D02F69